MKRISFGTSGWRGILCDDFTYDNVKTVIQAIADNIRTGLKKFGKVNDIEGAKDGKWIVMDYGDVLVHVFHDQIRRYYDLDGIWGMAPELELPAEIKAARKESDF